MKCTTLTLEEVRCKSALTLPQSLRKWRLVLIQACTCALKSKFRIHHRQIYCYDQHHELWIYIGRLANVRHCAIIWQINFSKKVLIGSEWLKSKHIETLHLEGAFKAINLNRSAIFEIMLITLWKAPFIPNRRAVEILMIGIWCRRIACKVGKLPITVTCIRVQIN